MANLTSAYIEKFENQFPNRMLISWLVDIDKMKEMQGYQNVTINFDSPVLDNRRLRMNTYPCTHMFNATAESITVAFELNMIEQK